MTPITLVEARLVDFALGRFPAMTVCAVFIYRLCNFRTCVDNLSFLICVCDPGNIVEILGLLEHRARCQGLQHRKPSVATPA